MHSVLGGQILVTSGVYGSPQILMLSGIGPVGRAQETWHCRRARTERHRRKLSGSPGGVHDLRGAEGIERRLGGAALPLDHSQKPDQRGGQLSHQHAAADGGDRTQAHDADLGAFARAAQPRPGFSPERRSARSGGHRFLHARTSRRFESDGRSDAVHRRTGAPASRSRNTTAR